MTDPWVFTIAFVVLLVVFLREWWRRVVIRKALNLSAELVRLLSSPEIALLKKGLAAYLLTQEGVTLVDDPRVRERQALFTAIELQRDTARASTRRRRALKATGLPELPATEHAA